MTDTVDTAPPAPSPETAAPMQPGTYLAKRRQAAGLSIEDLAAMLARSVQPHRTASLLEDLRALESNDQSPPRADLVLDMIGAFPFDLDVYRALVFHAVDPATEIPLPQLCRMCACSWSDPCTDDKSGFTCAWVEGDPELCTACLGEAAVAAAVLRQGGLHEA